MSAPENPPAILLDLWEYEQMLEDEWMIPAAVLWRWRAEITSLYVYGYTVREAAEYLIEKGAR